MNFPESKKECYYCHTKNQNIEGEGVWYCSNPLCTGPGAAWFRRTLDSYTENEDGTHSVDAAELQEKGNLLIKQRRSE